MKIETIKSKSAFPYSMEKCHACGLKKTPMNMFQIEYKYLRGLMYGVHMILERLRIRDKKDHFRFCENCYRLAMSEDWKQLTENINYNYRNYKRTMYEADVL